MQGFRLPGDRSRCRPVSACYAAFVSTAFAVLALAPAACATPSTPAQWPVQVLTVVNDAGVPSQRLERIERALVIQSQQLRAAWRTPVVRFGAGGWPVFLEHVGPGMSDYHTTGPDPSPYVGGVAGQGTPWAVVVADGRGWTPDLSHEVLEMLANPTTEGVDGFLNECRPCSSHGRVLGSTRGDRLDGAPRETDAAAIRVPERRRALDVPDASHY